MKTVCDYRVFERITWLYMTEYDAWFAPKRDAADIPVRCNIGTYDGRAYYVTYEPTGEAPANFRSGVVTLNPVSDGYYTTENHYDRCLRREKKPQGGYGLPTLIQVSAVDEQAAAHS